MELDQDAVIIEERDVMLRFQLDEGFSPAAPMSAFFGLQSRQKRIGNSFFYGCDGVLAHAHVGVFISPRRVAIPSSRLSAIRRARSMKTSAAFGGQIFLAVLSNISSHRSKCARSTGRDICACMGWP